MKATLEFNLPEDQDDFNYANNGFKYYMALVEMDEWLRTEYKYNGKEEMYEVREKLRQIIFENNVEIE
jgi:mannose-6-phosphate isomerase-like protein (cupin superfamily)